MADRTQHNRQRFKLSKNAIITAVLMAVVIVVTICALAIGRYTNSNNRSNKPPSSEVSKTPGKMNVWRHASVKNRVIDSDIDFPTCRPPPAPTTSRPTSTTTTANATANTTITSTTSFPTTTTTTTKTVNSSVKTAPVVGGGPVDEADVDRYPWMVRILFRVSQTRVGMCGGSLIDDLHILTAAHCVPSHFLSPVGLLQDTILGKIIVEMGGVTVNDFASEVPSVEAGFVHQAFRNSSTWTNHDVAVLRLNQSLTTSPHWNGAIRPVCLPAESAQPPDLCELIGWGKMSKDDPDIGTPQLRRLDVTVYRFPACLSFKPFSGAERFQNTFDYMEYICSSTGPRGGSDVCFGDSGGPLLCKLTTAGAGRGDAAETTEAAAAKTRDENSTKEAVTTEKTNNTGTAEAKAGTAWQTTSLRAELGAGSRGEAGSTSDEEITMQFGIISTTSAPCGALPNFVSFYSFVPFYRSWLRHVALPALQDVRSATAHLGCLRRGCLTMNASSFMLDKDLVVWETSKGYLCRVFAAYVYCMQSDAKPSRCRRTIVPVFYLHSQKDASEVNVMTAGTMLLLFDVARFFYVNVAACVR